MNITNEENKTVDTITLTDIESKPILWAWEPYLPIGTVSLLIGCGGTGKSFLSLAIAAAITTGKPLPGMETAMPTSDVIIQNAENPLGTVIKPRLKMLGADCSRVHVINDKENRLTLTDERIEAAIIRHNAKFVVIDPVTSYFGERFSMSRAESVRPAMVHLEQVAERHGAVILIIGHVNKSRGKAQYRGLGSVDFINAVPSVLYFGQSEDYDTDIRILANGKNNFSELGVSRMIRLSKAAGFQWLGECDVTPDEILRHNASRPNKKKEEEAVEFLLDILSAGPVLSETVKNLAEENDIKKRTLARAKSKLKVKSFNPKGDNEWFMTLPDNGEQDED